MLDSRYLSPGKQFQGLPASFYTTRVIIMRKKIVGLNDPFSGEFGENEIEYTPVLRGWPASIAPVHEDTKMSMAGQTVKASYILTCPYRITKDGALVVRDRDIVIDMSTRNKYLVTWSHDPMNTRVSIVAGLEYGTINNDLDRQG